MLEARRARPSRPAVIAAVALALAAALAATPAAAEPTKDKGNWTEALQKFKEVAAAKMTPQMRFHIALCEENLGKLVSAKRGFELAAAEGTAAGSAAVEVPPAAKQHADGLAARIAKLQIDVKGKLRTSKILLDGAALAEKDFGTEMEMDPGAHLVEVQDAAGKGTFRKEVLLTEKGSENVEVTVADADVAPVSSGGSSRVPAYVTGAVGVAALITSGVLFGLRASNIATITSHCKNPVLLTGCAPGDLSLASTGKSYTTAADALLGIGVAGVATGVVLFFVLGPKAQKSSRTFAPASASAAFWVAPTGPGLTAGGRF